MAMLLGKSKNLTMLLDDPPTEKDPLPSLNPSFVLDKEEEIFLMATSGRVESFTNLLEERPDLAERRDRSGYQLIHMAVLADQVDIVKVLASLPSGRNIVNARDKRGKTPMHIAVALGDVAMVQALLELKAVASLKDDADLMPVHIAADNDNADVLKVLLLGGQSPNAVGDGGFTPLHFAAAADSASCIRVLLQFEANILSQCNHGSYPIHVAAKTGSDRALEAILLHGTDYGVTKEKLLSLTDRDDQTAIHSSINGGSVECVALCLKHGSSILSQQISGSTPVHYAATQGNVELLRFMYSFGRKNMYKAVAIADDLERTPLHWAAVFNHDDAVRLMISWHADLNAVDAFQKTPLLLAAASSSWSSLKLLINGGAHTEVTDSANRNFLHIAVHNGIDLKEMELKSISRLKSQVNEKDNDGYTPLHYAAKSGMNETVAELIEMGASIRLKNKHRQSAFHIAAQNGRLNVCLLLLNSKNGISLKNETDIWGMSPLHAAAHRGHGKIVDMLIHKGSMIKRDNKYKNPLHHAASEGWTSCVRLLLVTHKNLIDQKDAFENTPLHLAAANGHAPAVKLLLTAGASIMRNCVGRCFFDDVLSNKHVAVAQVIIQHDRWEECLQYYSQVYGLLILGLIQHLPSVCLLALDRCVEIGDVTDKMSPDYKVTYNFRYLHLDDDYAEFAREQQLPCSPLLPLEIMRKHQRAECVSHPLTMVFLKIKWLKYGLMINVFDMIVYLIYLLCITSFITSRSSLNHYDPMTNVTRSIALWDPRKFPEFMEVGAVQNVTVHLQQRSNYQWLDPWFPPESKFFELGVTENHHRMSLWFIVSFCIFYILLTLIQGFKSGLKFLKELKNLLELFTYSTSLFFAYPFLKGYSSHIQWDAGAVAIFLAWFNCLVRLQRFDLFGLYVVMYLAIMNTLLQIFVIFMLLVTAFGLAFYVLLSHEPIKSNDTPLLSIYRTFILIFEIDYLLSLSTAYHDGDPESLHFSLLTYIFLGVFLFFMPLLLVNLMIGLAVGDIAAVQRHAEETKLETQVAFHARMEERVPFLRKLMDDKLEIYPNHPKKSILHKVTEIYVGNDEIKNDESQLIKELTKQKLKIKELTDMCATSNEMLTKVLKKMDITVTEAEESFSYVKDAGSMDDITAGFGTRQSVQMDRGMELPASAIVSARPSKMAQFLSRKTTFSSVMLKKASKT